MDALQKAERPFVTVVPPEFGPWMEEHKLPYVAWEFDRLNDRAPELTEKLQAMGCEFAVPLYEETVPWAGAVNARLQNNPRLFNRSLLFRDKAMMKRKAQIHGIQVGVFEEVDNHDDVRKFLKRVNSALLKLDEESPDPVHLKPKDAAGTVGHRMVKNEEDIKKIPEDEFPLLAESHLAGQEFSCEIFVHEGKIRFLNITEYVRLGYTNFIPASPELEKYRPQITKACEDLIEAFGVEYGFLHPEFFISVNGNIKFGEVAARVPGGHILELVERAYGFSPFVGMVMACDPKSTDEELEAFFPKEVEGAKGIAGCLMVYPKGKRIKDLDIPTQVVEDPYFERHTLVPPIAQKVQDREGFGNHFGTVFFFGDDPDRMRQILTDYRELDYYTTGDKESESEAPTQETQ